MKDEIGRPTDGQWRANEACLCIVAWVYAEIILNALLINLSKSFPGLNSPSIVVGFYAVSGIICLLLTLFYARVNSISEFKTLFGFRRPAARIGFLAIISGFALAALAIWLVKAGGVTPHSGLTNTFDRFGQAGAFDFKLLLFGFPFFEETIIRGYFYRALRQRYSVMGSIACILVIMAFTHSTAIFSSPAACICLIVLNILASLYRENTGSVWNCILFHVAYNVGVSF